MFRNIAKNQFGDNRPDNPVEGDSYYDRKTNSVYTYSSGIWLRYMLYQGDVDKNEDRIRKIKNLLK